MRRFETPSMSANSDSEMVERIRDPLFVCSQARSISYCAYRCMGVRSSVPKNVAPVRPALVSNEGGAGHRLCLAVAGIDDFDLAGAGRLLSLLGLWSRYNGSGNDGTR